MNVNVKQFANCIALATYLNQYCNKSFITVTGAGVHGIGKTRAANIAATILGGVVETVDASVLGEKELTGFLVKKPTGRVIFNEEGFNKVVEEATKRGLKLSDDQVVSLIKDFTEEETKAAYNLHQTIENIQKDQEYYYGILKTKGFTVTKNGHYYLNENGEEVIEYPDGSVVLVKKYSESEQRRKNEYNPYKFGDSLSPEDRIYLMSSKQIEPIIYFIDEINKDQIILTETMNILLARQIHGYELPWFVNCCAAMNPGGMDSDYNVRTLDPAQIDRLFYMNVHPDIDSFKKWALLDRQLPLEFVSAIEELGEESSNPYHSQMKDTTKITPSNRSLELAGVIYQHFDSVVNLPIFAGDIREHSEEYLFTMLSSILGYEYTGRLTSVLKDKDNIISVSDLIDGKDKEFNEEVLKKFKNKTPLAQKNFTLAFIGWVCENITRINSYKLSKDVEENRLYLNYKSQISKFFTSLDPSVLNALMDGIFTGDEKYQRIKQLDGKYKENQVLYIYLKDYFSEKILTTYMSSAQDVLN